MTTVVDAGLEAATSAMSAQDFGRAAELFYEAVAADPSSVPAHRGLADTAQRVGLGIDATTGSYAFDPEVQARANERLKAFYDELAAAHPDDAVVCWARGNMEATYSAKEPWFFRAVELDPAFAAAYQDLAGIALLRGDNARAEELLATAQGLAPTDPQLAITRARTAVDRERREQLLLDIVEKFPGEEVAAAALAELGRNDSPAEARRYLEELREQFPPSESQSSAIAMSELFALYVGVDSALALELARDLAQQAGHVGAHWAPILAYQLAVLDAQAAMRDGRPHEAVQQLSAVSTPRLFDPAPLVLARAEAKAAAGDSASAVEELLAFLAGTPNEEALALACRLSARDRAQIGAEVWERRDSASTAAPALVLTSLETGEVVDLAALEDRVVLVNFFFPACGPCRTEFPYLQQLTEQFADRSLTVLAVNGFVEQEELALPFLRGNGYTFQGLAGSADVGETWGVRGYPSNFLVDPAGRIVFRPHIFDARTRDLTALQIAALLDRAES